MNDLFQELQGGLERRLVLGSFLYIETEDEEIENSKYLLRINNKKNQMKVHGHFSSVSTVDFESLKINSLNSKVSIT